MSEQTKKELAAIRISPACPNCGRAVIVEHDGLPVFGLMDAYCDRPVPEPGTPYGRLCWSGYTQLFIKQVVND